MIGTVQEASVTADREPCSAASDRLTVVLKEWWKDYREADSARRREMSGFNRVVLMGNLTREPPSSGCQKNPRLSSKRTNHPGAAGTEKTNMNRDSLRHCTTEIRDHSQ